VRLCAGRSCFPCGCSAAQPSAVLPALRQSGRCTLTSCRQVVKSGISFHGWRAPSRRPAAALGNAVFLQVGRRAAGERPLNALAIAGVALYRFFAIPTPPPKLTPLTSYGGGVIYPSFSPDGREVAFSWNGPKPGNYHLYIKRIGTGEPRRLIRGSGRGIRAGMVPGRAVHCLRALASRCGDSSRSGHMEIWVAKADGSTPSN
jgi:hypothetical protein